MTDTETPESPFEMDGFTDYGLQTIEFHRVQRDHKIGTDGRKHYWIGPTPTYFVHVEDMKTDFPEGLVDYTEFQIRIPSSHGPQFPDTNKKYFFKNGHHRKRFQDIVNVMQGRIS